MLTLSNDFLSVHIALKGGEVVSVCDINKPYEYMWQANPAVWGRTAPVLFPVVGALRNQEVIIDGVSYPLPKHGFARDQAFEVLEHSPQSAVLKLVQTAATKALYPYHYTFLIGYHLKDRSLEVTYTLTNHDLNQALYASVGGHPGFNMPLDSGLCELLFDQEEVLNTQRIDQTSGLILRTIKPLGEKVRVLRLSPSTFDEDALIFYGLRSDTVTLRDPISQRRVSMSIKNCPRLGVWSPQANFVCLEPWWGIADYHDASGHIEDKELIRRVEAGQTNTFVYAISFH